MISVLSLKAFREPFSINWEGEGLPALWGGGGEGDGVARLGGETINKSFTNCMHVEDSVFPGQTRRHRTATHRHTDLNPPRGWG